jgi:hypothetical protein
MDFPNFFLHSLNIIEEELNSVERAMHGTESEEDDFGTSDAVPMPAKILLGATSPVWIPVAVVNLIIGMPVLGVLALSNKISGKVKLDKYEKDPRSYLENRSKKFLASLKDEDMLKYAEWQMEKTTVLLTNYMNSIPTLIKTNQRMVFQLVHTNRSQEEVLELYKPIKKDSLEMRKKITPLGIELCPVTVNERDLDWKQDMGSCLGEGEFSRVYRGKLNKPENATRSDSNNSMDVAVKVFKKPFDDSNLRIYINDEMNIRYAWSLIPFYRYMSHSFPDLGLYNYSNSFRAWSE